MLASGLLTNHRDDQHLVLALYQALAQRVPVAPAVLAQHARRPIAEVQRTLATWPDIETDSNGRIVGFGGLSLTATTHRLRLADRVLYTWCAYDPLFIVPLLGETARVESTCPATSRRITLTVTPGGVHDISPRDAVLSFVLPGPDTHDDVRERFCNHVRYFSSSDASTPWLDQHPRAFVLPIEDAFELATRANHVKFGAPVSTGERGLAEGAGPSRTRSR